MKKLFLLLALLLSLTAHADIQGAPFIPELDQRLDAIEQGNHIPAGKYPAGSADGHYVRQVAKATWDFAVQGGALGIKNLGVSIPAKAVETRTWIYDVTQPTTSASGTLAFACASQSNADLKQSVIVSSYPATGAVGEGTQTGGASVFSVVSSKCNISAIIATGALTAGKVVIYVEYSVHQ